MVLGRPSPCHWPEGPKLASQELQSVDRQIWRALTKKTLKIQDRTIDTEAWFGFLRVLIEELSVLSEEFCQIVGLSPIFNVIGGQCRIDISCWLAFQSLPHEDQLAWVEFAFFTMYALLSGTINTQGTPWSKRITTGMAKPERDFDDIASSMQKTMESVGGEDVFKPMSGQSLRALIALGGQQGRDATLETLLRSFYNRAQKNRGG
jgi:hypothetical protein